MAERLRTVGHMIDARDTDRIKALGFAVYDKRPCDKKNELSDLSNAYTAFPLHLAAANGHLDVIRLLLSAGAFPDCHSYALCCSQECVRPGSPQSWLCGRPPRWTPLHAALCMGQDDAFWELRAAGAKQLEFYSGPRYLLHHAIQLGRYSVAERLLVEDAAAVRADVNRRYPNQTTPFWVAYRAGHEGLMGRLAQAGAEVNDGSSDRTGCTPLHDACRCGDVDMAAVLLDLGASHDVPLADRRTWLNPAARACYSRFEELKPLQVVCEELIEGWHNPILRADCWRTLHWNHGMHSTTRPMPLHLERLVKGQALVKHLLDAGADMRSTANWAVRGHKMLALDALMAHERFKRFFARHGGLSGIMVAMTRGTTCDMDWFSATSPAHDLHYSELEASLKFHGLMRAEEHLPRIQHTTNREGPGALLKLG
jgi:ankyrin repeat protein